MNESKTTKHMYSDSVWATTYNAQGQETSRVNVGGGNTFVSFTSSRQGSSLPGYKEIIARGENATTPFTASMQGIPQYAAASLVFTKRGLDGKLQLVAEQKGLGYSFSSPAPSLNSTAANNQALKYAFAAVKQTRTSFQGGVFIGELREALNMIRNPAKSYRKGLEEYFGTASKRARRATRKSKQKILAETYLEYMMGWAPLIKDITGGIQAYSKLVKRVTISRVTRMGTDVAQSQKAYGSHYWGYIPLWIDLRSTTTATVRYIIAMKTAQQGASPDADGATRFGLIASEFVPTVWELIPWSFVADYFANIGDILNAVTTCTSDVAWICKTQRIEAVDSMTASVHETRLKADSPNAIVTVTGFPGQWSLNTKSIIRSSPLSLPIPSFSVSVPGNPIHWINLAALGLAQKRAISAL